MRRRRSRHTVGSAAAAPVNVPPAAARPSPLPGQGVPVSQKPVVFSIDPAALTPGVEPSDRFVFSLYFKPIMLGPSPDDPGPTDMRQLRTLLQSEIGWLFLDRTRIRPAGLDVGEHLHRL